ncbi:hypothetical protein ALQ93_200273 [Pseudomonas syringae pv. pisi]|jgi:hypothetical protein|uniref:Uncharacterized protein n=2 Tax=Pseudomonas syringae group TaxID=136849 RepID=F3G944_PSESJ|nr:hypothetical protein PSYPI_14888 [Pseudomonas syringae pv. pisi str. 1704B]RML59805.1 hypothetical protein ALQ93_200273 [Pseudomonas syringae pv. pisi]RMU90987.1 hypothetical protein ALP21_200303 [Pseudomonas savastanoi pv. phaseolicola]SOQ03925.1 hypothetical protein CFBP4215_04862 [Pseudomonas syringae pv. syringae]
MLLLAKDLKNFSYYMIFQMGEKHLSIMSNILKGSYWAERVKQQRSQMVRMYQNLLR